MVGLRLLEYLPSVNRKRRLVLTEERGLDGVVEVSSEGFLRASHLVRAKRVSCLCNLYFGVSLAVHLRLRRAR